MTALSARVTKPHESHLEAEERRQTEKMFYVYGHWRRSLNAVKVIGVKGQKVQDKRTSVGQVTRGGGNARRLVNVHENLKLNVCTHQ